MMDNKIIFQKPKVRRPKKISHDFVVNYFVKISLPQKACTEFITLKA